MKQDESNQSVMDEMEGAWIEIEIKKARKYIPLTELAKIIVNAVGDDTPYLINNMERLLKGKKEDNG